MLEDQRPGLELRLLGSLEARGPAGELRFGSRKERALLAALALRAGEFVSFGTLVDDLWGEAVPATAAATLRSLLSRLRRSLEASGAEAAFATRRGLGYRLDIERESVDSLRFERLVREGRRALAAGSPEPAAARLDEALSLWRGEALEDFAEHHFARAEARRLEELRLEATEELVELELSLGREAEALPRLQRQVADHPFREHTWGLLMICLYRLGRQADALRAFQQLREHLTEGLGIAPSPALRHLEHLVLTQGPELEGPPTRWLARATTPPGERPPGTPGAPAEPPSGPDTRVLLLLDRDPARRTGPGWAPEGPPPADDVDVEAVAAGAGGRVVARVGPLWEMVFPRVPDALRGALALLRAPAGSGGTPSPPRARAVVHVGAMTLGREGCTGAAVEQAEHLLEAAHDGQLLLTRSAAELVEDPLEVEAGVSLEELGAFVVEPGRPPQRVVRVVHPELEAVALPLRLPGPRRHNVPRRLGHFGGRERELAEVTALLRTSRLVTLTGIGGVGKTRLAIEVAERCLDRFPDGVFFAELAPLADPGLLGDQLLASLGVRAASLPVSGERAEHELARHLEWRAPLLVVDNCEHLIEPISAVLDRLLERCPGLSVLATSREPLGIVGEEVWSVPPLSLPTEGATDPMLVARSDAVTLFCARAHAVDPGFHLSSDNAGLVGQVCRRLDGIPLALELAAAQLRVLSLAQLAERLDERFRLLVGGARGAIARHRTLKAAMDWSYQLLAPLERLALRRLSVFPAGFDLEAAERLVEDQPALPRTAVLALLGSLTDKSLLVVEADSRERRYRLLVVGRQGRGKRYRLLETVREYGQERLAEAGETESARRGHRDLFLELVRRYGALDPWADNSRWLRRLQLEHDNLRAALEWSLASGDADACLEIAGALRIYWMFAGSFSEGCYWYERALAGADSRPTPARVAALNGFGLLVGALGGGLPRARRLHEEALADAATIGDRLGEATARQHLGLLALRAGDPDEAARRLGEARQVFLDHGWSATAAWCDFDLGWVAVDRGDPAAAEAAFSSVLEAARRFASDDLLAHALAALGPLAARRGEEERAARLVAEAVDLARGLALDELLAMALVRAGEVAILLRRPDEAEAILREVLWLLRRVDGRGWVADCFELLAMVREAQGRPERAAALIGASEALRRARHERVGGRRWTVAETRRLRRRIATAIGEERLVEERSRGARMAVDEALSFALEEPLAFRAEAVAPLA